MLFTRRPSIYIVAPRTLIYVQVNVYIGRIALSARAVLDSQ